MVLVESFFFVNLCRLCKMVSSVHINVTKINRFLKYYTRGYTGYDLPLPIVTGVPKILLAPLQQEQTVAILLHSPDRFLGGSYYYYFFFWFFCNMFSFFIDLFVARGDLWVIYR